MKPRGRRWASRGILGRMRRLLDGMRQDLVRSLVMVGLGATYLVEALHGPLGLHGLEGGSLDMLLQQAHVTLIGLLPIVE